MKSVKSSLTEENKDLKYQLKQTKSSHEEELKRFRDARKNEIRQWEASTLLCDKVTHQERLRHRKEQEVRLYAAQIKKMTSEINTMKPYYEHYQQLESERHRLDSQLRNAEEAIQTLRKETLELGEEKQNLLLRLEKMAGAKPSLDNPNIADLSDTNRPQKLAEEFAETYDNEWTDAFEDVTIENERQKMAFMVKLLQRAYEMCSHCMQELEDAVGRTSCTFTIPSGTLAVQSVMKASEENYDEVPGRRASKSSKAIDSSRTDESRGDRHKEAKQERTFECCMEHTEVKAVCDIRRRFALKVSTDIEKIGTEIILKEGNVDPYQQSVVAYVRKCLNICWSMCIHVPPIHIDFPDVTEDMIFDTNNYKPYTKSGRYVQYIVWPALYLHEGGPLLGKGVAQGRK